ncbi:MAG: enoyl-CoA hydratase-related protein, partial [Alphaproteobacteria bacterium]
MADAAQLANEPVLLHETLEDGIVRVTLNRPKAANSLSHELVHALHDAFEAYATDDKVRVIILAGGTGNPFFTTDTAAALRAA